MLFKACFARVGTSKCWQLSGVDSFPGLVASWPVSTLALPCPVPPCPARSFVQLCEACEACGDSVRALQAWRNTRRMQAGFTLGPHAAAALMKVYRSRGVSVGVRHKFDIP